MSRAVEHLHHTNHPGSVMISIKLEAGKVSIKVNDIVSDGNLIYDHTGNQHWKKSSL